MTSARLLVAAVMAIVPWVSRQPARWKGSASPERDGLRLRDLGPALRAVGTELRSRRPRPAAGRLLGKGVAEGRGRLPRDETAGGQRRSHPPPGRPVPRLRRNPNEASLARLGPPRRVGRTDASVLGHHRPGLLSQAGRARLVRSAFGRGPLEGPGPILGGRGRTLCQEPRRVLLRLDERTGRSAAGLASRAIGWGRRSLETRTVSSCSSSRWTRRTARGRPLPGSGAIKLAAAIRKHDRRHLVTVGLVPWSLDRPGLTSGFVPKEIAPELDFICVHHLPRSGQSRRGHRHAQGVFPGKAGRGRRDVSAGLFDRGTGFVRRSIAPGRHTDGSASIGARPPSSIGSRQRSRTRIVAGWIEWFQRHGPPAAPARFILGADISWVQEQEDEGIRFSDRGKQEESSPFSRTAASTPFGCGSSTTQRRRTDTRPRAIATWSTRCGWPGGSTRRGCSSCWTSTTATPGPIPATRSSRPPGPTCMAPHWRRRSTITPATC